MASHKPFLIAAAAMAVVVGALLSTTASAFPNSLVVGDLLGWNLNVDYDYWVKYLNGVKVGDTLEFFYLEGHNVVMMEDEESYNACVVPNNAQTFDATGHNIIQLPHPGKFFFICSMANHCMNGMKLAITAIP